MDKIKFENLPDIITPLDLINSNFPGGKSGVYSLFNRRDFPKSGMASVF